MQLSKSNLSKLVLALLFALAFFMWAKILTAQESDYSFGVGVASFDAAVYGGTVTNAVTSSIGGRVAFYYGNGTQVGVTAFYSSLSTKPTLMGDTDHPIPGEDWGHYGIEAMVIQSFNTGTSFEPHIGAVAGYAWLNPGEMSRTTTGPVIGILAGNLYKIARTVDLFTTLSLESHQFSQISTPYGVIDNAVIWSLMVGLAIS